MKLHLRRKSKKNNNRNIPTPKKESYKDGLMQINVQEEKYDKLFEQKLAAQYREFKNIKEYKLQSLKFVRIIIILAVIMIIALLVLTYS